MLGFTNYIECELRNELKEVCITCTNNNVKGVSNMGSHKSTSMGYTRSQSQEWTALGYKIEKAVKFQASP